jgi:type VI secretion system FHA domain protein
MSMALVLRLEGADGVPTLFEAAGGATIGRAAGNDLVLPDESRAISKRHCELVVRDHCFRLVDHSRNGTFLNDAAEPVGPAAAVPISAGDVIRVGAVRITVVAATAPPPAKPGMAGDALTGWDASPGRLAPDEPSELFPSDRPGTAPPEPAAAFADHVPAEAGLFVQPRVGGEAIPDDWDLVGELRAALPAPPEPVPEAAAPAPPALPATVPVQPPEAARFAPPAAQAGRDSALVAAFLQGCGLPPLQDGGEPELLMARAGRLLARMVAELHGLLAIRSLAKQEFGMERTMIARSDNNPLKFATAPQEALPLLLASEVPGFLSGEEAVREGFDSLRSHQLAVFSATQSAVATLCARLTPDAIAASPPLWARPLPFARDAARWAAYRQAYEEVVSTLDSDLRAALGDAAQAGRDGTAQQEDGHAG